MLCNTIIVCYINQRLTARIIRHAVKEIVHLKEMQFYLSKINDTEKNINNINNINSIIS